MIDKTEGDRIWIGITNSRGVETARFVPFEHKSRRSPRGGAD